MKYRILHRRLTLAAAALGAVVFNPAALHAATVTWNGSAADLNWNTGLNWSSSTPPLSADIATFNENGYAAGDTILTGADQAIGRLTINFSSSSVASKDLILGGANTITLNGSTNGGNGNIGLVRGANTSGTQTINANLQLGSSQIWNITGSGGTAPAGGGTNGRLIVNGVIGETAGGAKGLTKIGNQILELDGNNTYTGTTTVNANALVIGNNNALGAGNSTVFVGATSGTTTPSLLTSSGITFSRNVQVNSGAGAVRLGGAPGQSSSIWSGNIALNRDVNISAGNGSPTGIVDFQGGFVDGTDPNNAFISSNITKIEGGTVKLSSLNTYSGSTTVNAGALLVNGSLSASVNPVSVNGGRLGGTGTISRPVSITSSGTIRPGDGGPGTLTINNGQTLTLASGSTYTWEAGASPGTSDSILTSLLNLTGSPTLKILSTPNAPDPNSSYTLVSWDGPDPTSLPSWTIDPASTLTGTISYVDAADGIPGGQVVLTSVVAAAPEPASVSLLGLGAMSLLRRRNRTRFGH
jgi:fibronectin-binding autotransporter adhesin